MKLGDRVYYCPTQTETRIATINYVGFTQIDIRVDPYIYTEGERVCVAPFQTVKNVPATKLRRIDYAS